MRKFMEAMEKDYLKENFTMRDVVLVHLFLIALLVIMGLAGWMDSVSGL